MLDLHAEYIPLISVYFFLFIESWKLYEKRMFCSLSSLLSVDLNSS